MTLNLKTFFTVFFLGAATPLWGSPNYAGILVQFRGAPQQNIGERNALHESLKQKLIYRSKFLNVDVLAPAKRSKLADMTHLKEICLSYLQNPLVLRCEPNEIFRRAWADPTSHEGLIAPAPPRTVVPSDGCALVDLNIGEKMMDGTLSPFWAQELIGADLAGKVLEEISGELKLQGKELGKTSVGVVDVGFDPSDLSGPVASTASIRADPVATTPASPLCQ